MLYLPWPGMLLSLGLAGFDKSRKKREENKEPHRQL